MKTDAARVKSRLFADGVIGDVKYPDMTLAVDTTDDGQVRLNFGRPLTWFALSKDEALALAKSIAARAGAKRIEIT